MARTKLKHGKTVITLTMGPKEAKVVQALVDNCAENSHAYAISTALDDILGHEDTLNVTVRTEDATSAFAGYPVINVEQH